ncbi:TPA: hypothetical protein ACH3X1_002757 [Trebouxia sp. C0004]
MACHKNRLHGLYDAIALLDADGKTVSAGELWKDRPVLILCLRRLGCILCRAEAKKLYASKPAFDELGIRLITVVHQMPKLELEAFKPAYWDGEVYLDQSKDLFVLAGGGQLRRGSQLTFFNPFSSVWKTAIAAKNTVDDFNFKGVGSIMGGIIVMQAGSGGVEYIFTEKNFGQFASNEEIIASCRSAARQQQKGSKHRLKPQ